MSSSPLPSRCPNLRGRSALVVGGTAGIGEGIAVRLAQCGASVTIAGRSETAGNGVLQRMRSVSPTPADPAAFQYLKIDASNIKSLPSFAKHFDNRRLDYLVLCQSIASFGGFQPTEEDIEIKLALHAHSRFALSNLLLPSLRLAKTPPSDPAADPTLHPRVLSVLSGGVHSPFLEWDNLDLRRQFSLSRAANAAGFLNDAYFAHLAELPQNSGIGFLHAAPGFVRSNWGDQTALAPLLKVMKRLFARTTDECGVHMVDALASKDLKEGFHTVDKDGHPSGVTSAHTPENIHRIAEHVDRVLGGLGIRPSTAQ